MTGWGLCDVVLLAGRTDGDEVVFVLVPAREGAGAVGVRPAARSPRWRPRAPSR